MDDGLWHEMMKKVIKELSLSISLKMPWHLISGLAKLVPFSSLRGEGVMFSFANEGCGGMRGRPWKPLNKKAPGGPSHNSVERRRAGLGWREGTHYTGRGEGKGKRKSGKRNLENICPPQRSFSL